MNDLGLIASLSAGAIALILLITIFRAPVKLIIKLLVNTLLGFGLLIVLNYFGKFIGVTLGVNLLNALVVGIFGVPGVGLLLLLQWLMLI